MIAAAEVASLVAAGTTTAKAVVDASLARVAQVDTQVNAFTTVTADRARSIATSIDQVVASGGVPGPLAGVPFAVKDLYDLEGVVTVAGSRVFADDRPAEHDAAAVAALVAAGAVPIGALNMDEFAFGFTTENTHRGSVHNPHDLARSAGGSSGGSAASVAAGMVSVALGTDTNGSVRVPASLCGVFGLKPTYGRVSRSGVRLFSSGLDHVGAFARSVADLELVYSSLQTAGPDEGAAPPAGDPAPLSGRLRVARLGGWFVDMADAAASSAVDHAAAALGSTSTVEAPLAEAMVAAASVITYAEAGELHLDRIRQRRREFDPVVRHRLTAAALLPADWYVRAQRVRRMWVDQLAALFVDHDVLLAPATPFSALRLGTDTVVIGGREFAARPAVGSLTQPLTPSGVPIGVAPVWPGGPLPIGVQVIAAPWREDVVIAALRALEADGVASSPIAAL